MKTNLTLALSLLAVALATPVLVADDHRPESSKVAASDPMFDRYAAISTALYKDDLEGARNAAKAMSMPDKDSPMAKHCQAIADSKTIAEARMHFKELSDLAIPVAKEKGTMHEMHCPMAAEGKGANWLQKSGDEVQNPYMGSKMPHCGKMVK